METLIEGLAQYGPLGMWTASLLWMNWQQRKDQKEEERMAAERLAYHQENIVEAMREQRHMLDKALEKIDSGLSAMKEKYAEDRILRMKNEK
jgi:Flp pilus assembly protein TadB